MLSAHTTDKSVNAATRKLFPVANTPQAIFELGDGGRQGVPQDRRSVQLQGEEPDRAVQADPGAARRAGSGRSRVARSAARAWAARRRASFSTWCSGRWTSRSTRTSSVSPIARGWRPGKNPRAVEDALVANTPDEFKKNAHHWLLLHGRYVCTARKPACPKCIISDLCEYPDKTPAGELSSSDAPVAHRQAPPAIADRIEGALKAKAAGRLGGKPRAAGVRSGAARVGRGASAGKPAQSGKKAVRAPASSAAEPDREIELSRKRPPHHMARDRAPRRELDRRAYLFGM